MSSYAGYLIETFVTLVAVCALSTTSYSGVRVGWESGRPRGPIELWGHLPLDARRGIYLVKVGGQVLVVGVGEGGFTKLGELPASELPREVASQPSFAEVLSRAMAGGKKADAPREEARPQRERPEES